MTIIPLCRHVLSDGYRCRGAAVRGRACCRHHLDARARLHNMARARRLACIPRIRAIETPSDLAANRAEINRVLATGGLDFATARMMFWALRLVAATFRDPAAVPSRRAAKPNGIYHVSASPLFLHSYPQNPSEVVENKVPKGGLNHFGGQQR